MRRRMRTLAPAALLLLATLACGTLAGSPARAADGAPGSSVTVGIKPLDPFVQRTGQRYTGFSIDLWDEISRRNSWTTTYTWHDTLPPLLADVQAAKVDAGIAGISITKDREQVLDFSYPMFTAGLEILATNRSGGASLADELSGFVTAGVGRYLVLLVIALVFAGHVVWLATRRRTGQGYLVGVGNGLYKAAGLGLVGDYGVGDPQRPAGRFVAVVWSIFGICFVSLFTAAVTTQLTVQSIQSSIRGVSDLRTAKVVTVSGTSAATFLTGKGIAFTAVATIDDAFPLLDNGKADAVVFDAPVLDHHLQVNAGADEVVIGGLITHEDYGIAFPTGSALRKKVNTTLLEMRADGTYDRIYALYFGTPTS